MFMLVKYTHVDVSEAASVFPVGVPITLYMRQSDTRFSATMVDPLWDSLLGEHLNIDVGLEPSNWRCQKIEDFFGRFTLTGQSRFDLLIEKAQLIIKWMAKCHNLYDELEQQQHPQSEDEECDDDE